METAWDVVIVGARCAGAPLATILARSGVKTLLLEASARGADMPMSTHLVQAPGMDVLDRLGVGDRVRAVTPASSRFRLALDEVEVLSESRPDRAAYCVRRSTIDPWLQEAAEQGGATFLDRHRVVDLLRENDRVTGVVARSPSGTVTFKANLVVGADGPHSTVAKLTGVEDYLVTEGSRAGYWAYFPQPESWDECWDATIEHRGDELRYAFRCDDGTVAVVYTGERETVAGWGRDYRARLRDAYRRSETTRKLTEGKEPIGKILGLLKTRFFYRRPVGAGFALVGDAGHFKDFVTGQGMTDAFIDAERLSRAILDGRPEAFEHYWRLRDVETLPLHFDANRQGTVGYNDAFMRWVMFRLGKNDLLKDRLAQLLDRKLQPSELVPMSTMLRFMGSALLRGRFDVLSGFMKVGPALNAEKQELTRNRVLHDRAQAALDRAEPRMNSTTSAATPSCAPSIARRHHRDVGTESALA